MAKEETTGPDGQSIRRMEPVADINTAVQIWKGPPKIGKTSTAAALGDVSDEYDLGVKPFFMIFEPGTGGVGLNGTSQACPKCKGTGKEGKKKCEKCSGVGTVRLILSTLEDMDKWFEWFVKSEFTIAVIDTFDAMFQAVMDSICVQLGIISPVGAEDHGVSWTMIYDKCRELLGILKDSGKGIILIMHLYTMEKRVRGGTVPVLTFNVSGKTRPFVAGMANQILHFDIVPNDDGKGDKRVLFAAPQSGIEAGDQWNLFPPQLDLGGSPKEAAEAILEAFGYLESK